MKTLYVHLSIGYPTADCTDELEIEDDATEAEKEEIAQDWASNYIEVSWSDTKPKRRWR